MPSLIGNFFIKTIVNSPLHALLGDSFAVITVEGRKSGRLYSTPINVKRQKEGWIVISMRERTWWRNLRDGQTAILRIDGRKIPVRGKVVEEQNAVSAGLEDFFRQYPGYARYFKIRVDKNGKPDPVELGRAAGERILIQLLPI